MKKRDQIIMKAAVNLLIIFAGTIALILFLGRMQNQVSRQQQYEESSELLDLVVSTLETNERDAAQLTRVYHNGNRQTLQDLVQLFESGLFDGYFSKNSAQQAVQFGQLRDQAGVDYLFVMKRDGTIVLAPTTLLTGKNLREMNVLSDEQLAILTSDSAGTEQVRVTTDRGEYYYYAAEVSYRSETYYLVLGERSSVLQLQYDSLTDISDVIGQLQVGDSGFLFAVDMDERVFAYYRHDGKDLTGQSVAEAGITEILLNDGKSGTVTIGGESYYCVSRAYQNTTIVCAAVSEAGLYSRNAKVVFWAALIFVMALVVTLLYTIILRRDLIRRNEPVELKHLFGTRITINKTVGRKILPITIAGILIIFGVTFYSQTLLALTRAMDMSGRILDQLETQIADSNTTRGQIKAYYYDHYLAKARMIAFLLEMQPSALNEPTEKIHTRYTADGVKTPLTDDEGNPLRSVSRSSVLQQLSLENGLAAVYVYDEQGRTIATSTSTWYFALSMNPDDQSYPFRDVLDGRLQYYVQEMQTDETGNEAQYIGTAFTYYTTVDSDGSTRYASALDYQLQQKGEWQGNPIAAHHSLLQIAIDTEQVGGILGTTDINYLMEHSTIPDGGFLVAFDNTPEHVLVYSPHDANIGKTASELGIDEICFSDNYHGFVTVNGVRYFESYHYENGYYVAVCIPLSVMYRARFPIALVTTLVSLVVLVLMQSLFLLSTEEGEEELRKHTDENKAKESSTSQVNASMPTGERRNTMTAISRWSRKRFSWSGKTPEQKLMTLLRGCGFLFIVYLAIMLAVRDRLFSEGSIIRYIISGTWGKGFNTFALSRCLLLFLTVIVGVAVINYVIRLVTSIFGARTETVGHLLMSVIKYGSALGALFYSLYLLGFDSTSLLTSAGILSVVVGLGAQSLISDIIAGIFIVFEGEFRVGDIVTIGDTRGTVMEIGIRTTKIADALQNIKIYNNSTISNVLNMTRKASIATCTLSVAYGESIERIESVLAKEFPRIKKKLPSIIDGPFYRGVKELGESSVDLLITATCNEADRLQLSRDLNREIFILCGKNDINIPFPQVTVSYLDEEYEKETASRYTQRSAEKFVNEQKETSRLQDEPQD